ncbi:MAG: hypothetical protein H6619_00150 [Deltaproteobacteria bacterium]|nr:hypothetical protein [Deltaproteobacteria bacterium]
MRIFVYIIALTFALASWSVPIHDPDLGWHLFGGSWIVAHGELPSFDPINSLNLTWTDYHWLAQILFYKLYEAGGYELLRLFFGLLIGYLGILIVDICYLTTRRKGHPYLILIAFGIALTIITVLTTIRPHAIALVLIALSYRRLLQQKTTWELPYLFLLASLCVNIHVYWIMIPFLWFCYRAVPRLLRVNSKESVAYAWGGLIILSLSGLVSPYGIFNSTGEIFANYLVIYDYLVMPASLREIIHELKGTFAVGGIVSILSVVIIAILFRYTKYRHLQAKPGNLFSLFGLLILSIRSLKFATLFGLVTAPQVARNLTHAKRKFFPNALIFRQGITQVVLIVVFAFGVFRAINLSPFVYDNTLFLDDNVPLNACRKIASLNLKSKSHKHLRVLTHFNDGGWCRWAAYLENPDLDLRVTADGRTQLVPGAEIYRLVELYNLHGHWATTLHNIAPDVILAHKDLPLAQLLVRAQTEWRVIHEDPKYAVFARQKSY